MGDLFFDPIARDLVITDGDFTFTDNPSIQNAEIMKDAHCFSILKPIFGIGLQRVMNAPVRVVNFEMNRWQQQVLQDGATKANFTITIVNNEPKIDITISYV
jgi:hypothetical protein